MTAEIHHLSTGERVHRIPSLDAWAEPDGPQTPREPTLTMTEAGLAEIERQIAAWKRVYSRGAVFKAMVAASPSHPAAVRGGVDA